MRKAFFVGVAAIFISTMTMAGDLQKHLEKRSSDIFKDTIKKDAGSWKVPIEKAFDNLKKVRNLSDNKPIKGDYAVTGKTDYTARMLPGGQLILTKSVLDLAESWVKSNNSSIMQKGRIKDISQLRERLMAALIAHELAHFLQGNALVTVKKNQINDGVKNFKLENIRYDADQVQSADMGGSIALKQAGYDSEDMIIYLNFLNDIYQQVKKGKHREMSRSMLAYLENPTPRKRLENLDNGGKDFHEMIASLEKAFDDIRFGRNFKETEDTLKEALIKYPENIYFMKAKAINMHKQWLSSVKVDDFQKIYLKAIVGLPRFRDEMINKSGSTRGSDDVPGKQRYYYKSAKIYKEVFNKTGYEADPEFLSSYSTLLVYDKETRQQGIQYADQAYNLDNNITISSNHALVYFVAGNLENSIGKKEQAEKRYKNLFKKIKYRIIKGQSADPVPILNYALVLHYMGKKKKLKDIVINYLHYDRTSSWAMFLSEITKISIPKPSNNKYSINLVKLRDTTDSVIQSWGEPSGKTPFGNKGEYWEYEKLGGKLLVHDDLTVAEIHMTSPGSLKVNGKFGIGSTKEAIEKELGQATSQTEDIYFMYGKWKNIVIQYRDGKASEIVIRP